ncbi:iron-containing alcohol dehydrogenase family protein [Acerihabitans arboris]|uniref:Iron-containing alcohol dehydrogenase n=1 Tax=Acerihabitans arboris TaxID=2691583 RepID=A0A845SPF8_9GAMM|nr:iron-containing alcohol dehydrogenase family protein [Acerihabitans arboris]NDL65252.1 iron-containing alcohol dehydrogenase [Acerihabitans arboris]
MIVVKAPQNYLNEAGLIKRIGEFVAPITRDRVMIITSPRAWQATRQALETSFGDQGISCQHYFLQGECTRATIGAFSAQAAAQGIRLVIGIGGGKVLDTAKGIAESSGRLPLITVPTIAATCAAWSPISVLYTEAGGHLNSMPLQRTPEWVLVDSGIIAATPVRYLKAGIVDALAKWYEFEPYLRRDDSSLSLALKAQAARLALDIFEQSGAQALADNEAGVATPVFVKVVDAVIALAGMANSMRDEFPRIGIAHAVHNSMTYHPDLHGFLHGELVGFGLVVQSFLDEDRPQAQDHLLQLLRSFSTPLTLRQLGVAGSVAERIKQIALGIKISQDNAARLPFALGTERIERALAQTARLDEPDAGRDQLSPLPAPNAALFEPRPGYRAGTRARA